MCNHRILNYFTAQSLGSSKEKVIESFDKVTVENDLIKENLECLLIDFQTIWLQSFLRKRLNLNQD